MVNVSVFGSKSKITNDVVTIVENKYTNTVFTPMFITVWVSGLWLEEKETRAGIMGGSV